MSLKPKVARSSKRPTSTLSKKKWLADKEPRDKNGRPALGLRGGRFSEYDPRYCQELIEFAKKPEGYFSAFAVKVGVSKDTLYNWAKDHEEFRIAKNIARETNEKVLYELGLKGMKGKNGLGSWQSAWIFTMKARFGWNEDGPTEQEEGELVFNYT